MCQIVEIDRSGFCEIVASCFNRAINIDLSRGDQNNYIEIRENGRYCHSALSLGDLSLLLMCFIYQ